MHTGGMGVVCICVLQDIPLFWVHISENLKLYEPKLGASLQSSPWQVTTVVSGGQVVDLDFLSC